MKKGRGIWSNEKLLSKAAITSDSFAGGIGLSTEEADRFIDFIVDESSFKDGTRIVRMNKHTKKIEKLGLSTNKVLKPAQAVTDPGETVSQTTDQILLTTSEMIAVFRISDDALEDNIEGDAFAEHMMQLVAKESSNQLEDALLYGRKEADTAEQDEVTQLWDGWISKAESTGHIVDASSTALFADRFISTEKLSKTVKALPTKWRKNRGLLKFGMADDLNQDYIDIQGARATQLGDRRLEEDGRPRYGGVNFFPHGLFRIDRPVVVIGGGASTLAGAEAKGATSVTLVTIADYDVGNVITFDFGGPREESHTILTLPGGNVVTFAGPGLAFNQKAGAVCRETTLDGTDVLLANYQNLIWGIQRDVRIELDRLPRLRATDWVMTMRMTAEVENDDALAILVNAQAK